MTGTYVWTRKTASAMSSCIAENRAGEPHRQGPDQFDIGRDRRRGGSSIISAATTETFIWPVDGGQHDAARRKLAELMTHAGLPTYLAPDIDYRIWRKLASTPR